VGDSFYPKVETTPSPKGKVGKGLILKKLNN
jgi:hypothetical protein